MTTDYERGFAAGVEAAAEEIHPGPYPECCGDNAECENKIAWHRRRNLAIRVEALRAPSPAPTPDDPDDIAWECVDAWTYRRLRERWGARALILGNPDLLYFDGAPVKIGSRIVSRDGCPVVIPPPAPTPREDAAPINQCDGCRRGLPFEDGVHRGIEPWDLIACTANRYVPRTPASDAAPLHCGCSADEECCTSAGCDTVRARDAATGGRCGFTPEGERMSCGLPKGHPGGHAWAAPSTTGGERE